MHGTGTPQNLDVHGEVAIYSVGDSVHAQDLGSCKDRVIGKLPDRVAPSDVVLTGVASHKLSRLLAKDKVTAWLRAPFTRYQQPGGPSELEESPRGSGARRAIGELIVCPYCLGMWTSAGLHVGLLYAPRVTRLISSTFTALTISDFLQIAYKAAEERGLGGE